MLTHQGKQGPVPHVLAVTHSQASEPGVAAHQGAVGAVAVCATEAACVLCLSFSTQSCP